MKRIVVLILAIMYISTSSGIVMSTHFCMGKKPSKCLCSKEENDCCKDEVKVVKLENVHKASVTASIIPTPAAILPPTYFSPQVPDIALASLPKPVANAPPEISSPPIYIRHCAYLI